MKKFYLSLFLILSLLSTASLAQTAGTTTAAKPFQSYEIPIVTRTLPNGLEVIVLQDSSVPLATVELDVRNGSFTETPELNGLSHLFEHMFFKPSIATRLADCERNTSNFPSNSCRDLVRFKPQIGSLSYLDDRGQLGRYNGTTREEVVNYFYTVSSPYVGSAIKMINDSVRFPTFDETEFENEKRVVIGEIDRHESNPYDYLMLSLNEKLFYKYPTRKKPRGTRETVAAATTAQMRQIQSRYYVPNNAALVVTGDVNPEEVFKLAEQHFGSWERSKTDPFKEYPMVEHPPLAKSEGILIEKTLRDESSTVKGENVMIQIGWQGPSIGKDNEGTYAADVFSYIVGQPDSRFQRKMVDSGLVSAIGINYYTQRNVGPISVLIVTTPAKAKAAVAAAYAEIAQFTDPAYFSNEELESAKTILESNDLFEREKITSYSNTLGFWWSSTGIDYYRGYHKNLRAVSRTQINSYLKTYVIGKPHIGVALLSPAAQKEAKLTEQDLIGAAK